jgi:SlyX protein
MSDERLTNLEARFAWLERHVVEQDRAMAEMGEELRRLRRELVALRERLRGMDGAAGAAPADEPPPPHY